MFFRGECTGEDDDCDGVLAKVGSNCFLFFIFKSCFILDQLEAVDDELDEIGILLVSTPDEEVAQEHGQDFFLGCE